MGAAHTTGRRRDDTAGRVLPAGRWRVLPDRSRIGFRVRKMGLYYVKGRFSRVTGTLDPAGRGEVVIDAASISTRIPPRDWHLRSADFLDVKRNPEIRASVDSIEPAGEGDLAAVAVIDLHGERGPVELRGHLHQSPDAGRNGAGRLLLHLEGTLDRHAFGIRARPPVEWIVGRDVLLDVELALEPISGEDPVGGAPQL
ncbi:MAG: YceI family protein [Thermoleophilaceae bacterium]